MRKLPLMANHAGRNPRTGQAFWWTITLLFLLSALLACAGEGRKPGVLRATLENGLKVVIVPNTLAPVATVIVNYLVGSNEAPPGREEVDQVLDQLFTNGTTTLDRLAFQKALDEIAAEASAGTART